MSQSRNVGVLVGSLRKESYTRKIARGLIALAPPTLSLSFIEIGELPLYNPDLDTESPPKPWTEFRQRVRETDALLFCTPEHNRGMPAEWVAENRAGRPRFNQLRAEGAAHPIEKVGAELRAMMPFVGAGRARPQDVSGG